VQATKWKRCTWHVYAFHALMEWYQSRAHAGAGADSAVTIAKKIFDYGLAQPHVQSQPEYIRAFANWLVSAPAVTQLECCVMTGSAALLPCSAFV
jgi:Suppressor of forked protein (Suf)